MGCNCKETEGFNELLNKARIATRKTGITHVVYVHEAVKVPFMRKEMDLDSELGICCYFLPDGTEVEVTDKTFKDLAKVKKDYLKSLPKPEANVEEVTEETVEENVSPAAEDFKEEDQ